MKILTDIAVRLRIISNSLLSIFGAIAIGILIGLWLSHSSFVPSQSTTTEVSNQKWCDTSHTVPYIPASQCGGGSSCDRAQFSFGKDTTDWTKLCANITKRLSQ